MRGKGITYDTGFFHAGRSTHEPFVPEIVRREMRVIQQDLHCTAVRITGGDLDRLELAATAAAASGLEVWFSPFTCDLSTDALLGFVADGAARVERLRRQGAKVVVLVGSEVSLFNHGFLPGQTLEDRLGLLAAPTRLGPLLGEVPARLNAYLGRAVALVRACFDGPVSYASLPFEGVDWAPFDLLATDAGYRSREVAPHFRSGIRALVAQGQQQGKPVAITEFGCCTYRGAADRGGRGDQIVVWEDGRPVRLDGDYVRDEAEQATYLGEMLAVFEAEGVDSAFWNTFARRDLPHRPGNPRTDLDLASYGLVKVLDGRSGHTESGLLWAPKLAFYALAKAYAPAA